MNVNQYLNKLSNVRDWSYELIPFLKRKSNRITKTRSYARFKHGVMMEAVARLYGENSHFFEVVKAAACREDGSVLVASAHHEYRFRLEFLNRVLFTSLGGDLKHIFCSHASNVGTRVLMGV